MSKKSVKRKVARSKNGPVKVRTAGGHMEYVPPHTKMGTLTTDLRSDQRKILEQEAAAMALGLTEGDYTAYETAHHEHDIALCEPCTSMDFWLGEIDTPLDVIKRLERFPEVSQLELINDFLLRVLNDSKSSLRIRTLAGAVIYSVLFANDPICTPTGRARRGRPVKAATEKREDRGSARPDLTITGEEERRCADDVDE